MNGSKFIICMVSVLSLGIGGDCRSVEAQNPQNNNGSASETFWSSKLPSQSTCGRTNVSAQRIVGGNFAEIGAWPWMAALGYIYLKAPLYLDYIWGRCGGVLISDRYVLTAAHCTVRINEFKLAIVRLGDLKLDPLLSDGAIQVAISSIMTHKLYNGVDFTNDIALLKLENSVEFNKFIQPICLPILPNHINQTFVNTEPFAAGWGRVKFNGPSSEALMEVQVPVVKNSECKLAYSKVGIPIGDNHLCAGITGKDVCQGDSGGPLMWPSGTQYYVVGVVSFGHKCGERGYPNIYSRVTSFVEWIAHHMNDC